MRYLKLGIPLLLLASIFVLVFVPTRPLGRLVAQQARTLLEAEGYVSGIELPRAALREFRAKEVVIRHKAFPFPFSLKRIRATVSPISLLTGELYGKVSGELANAPLIIKAHGPLSALLESSGSIVLNEASLPEIPMMRALGISSGILSADLRKEGPRLPSGEVRWRDLSSAQSYSIPLDLAAGQSIGRLSIPKINDWTCALQINSHDATSATVSTEECENNLLRLSATKVDFDVKREYVQVSAEVTLSDLGMEAFGSWLMLASGGKVRSEDKRLKLLLVTERGTMQKLQITPKI